MPIVSHFYLGTLLLIRPANYLPCKLHLVSGRAWKLAYCLQLTCSSQ